MDLKSKLRLHQNKKDDQKKSGEKKVEKRREFSLPNLLPGKFVETEYGEFFLAEYRYSVDICHGNYRLDKLIDQDLSALCGVLKNEGLICPEGIESLAFLDTETTGLAGGAGTYAFMVGLGYFEDQEFVLQQYMMEDYPQELAMMNALYEKLKDFSHLVTFNGKSFDWPLLKGRFIYHQMKKDLSFVHVDLLHPARRYYKRRLASCNLGSIEEEVLGFVRENDIPGELVPELFFSYVQDKDGRIIAPVFRHNHWDILSLTTLLTQLLQNYLQPTQILTEPEDIFSAGKVYEDLCQYSKAIKCYNNCLELKLPSYLEHESLERLSFIYKRLEDFEQATSIWQQFIDSGARKKLFPYIELAKYYEHRLKNYQKALEMTRGAQDLLIQKRHFYDRDKFVKKREALEHRQERLKKKISKAKARTS